MKTNKRGYLEISFGWLFAIIAGAAILVAAIFLSTKIMGIGQKTSSAETQKLIENELSLFETSSESAIVKKFEFGVDTQLFFDCSSNGNFGKQYIGAIHKSFNRWPEDPLQHEMTSSLSRYIFSEQAIQGKKFNLISKPFAPAFKIADVIYFTSLQDTYCFIDAPQEIQEEIQDWELENIENAEGKNRCSEESITVCFNSESGCDIQVFEFQNKIVKEGKTFYFLSDSLMYAAIFSSKEVYDCNVKRLMLRADSLLNLYLRKSEMLFNKACTSTEVISTMQELKLKISAFKDSSELGLIQDLFNELKMENGKQIEACRIW